MSPIPAYFSFARATPEHASHTTCREMFVTATYKIQWLNIIGSSFLCLFKTHPPIAVLSEANQRKCRLDSSEYLFSYCLMCNPGCNEVNTGEKSCVHMVVVMSKSFWFWGFIPPRLGESRTICAFSWEMIAFLLRWSNIRCLELRDAPSPKETQNSNRVK